MKRAVPSLWITRIIITHKSHIIPPLAKEPCFLSHRTSFIHIVISGWYLTFNMTIVLSFRCILCSTAWSHLYSLPPVVWLVLVMRIANFSSGFGWFCNEGCLAIKFHPIGFLHCLLPCWMFTYIVGSFRPLVHRPVVCLNVYKKSKPIVGL